jgi:hypothetical protein
MRCFKLVLLTAVGIGGGMFLSSLSRSEAGQPITPPIPDVWVVCPQGPPECQFARIQEAIATAKPNDLIQIQSGTYSETLVISKSLRLVGAGRDQVRLQGAEPGKPALTLQVEGALNLLLEGLTLAGAPPASAEQPCFRGPPAPPESLICPHGIETRGQGALTLILVDLQIVESYGAGLICSGPEFKGASVRLTMIHSRLANNRGSGVVWSCGGEGDFAISLQDSIISGNGGHGFLTAGLGSEIDISDSTFSGNRYAGVSWVGHNVKLTVSRSSFMSNGRGIEITTGMQGSAKLNQITVLGNGDGVALFGTDKTSFTLENSILQENGGVSVGAGLFIVTTGRVEVEGNLISQNQNGLVIRAANPAKIDNNRILGNEGWGVALHQPSCFEVPDVDAPRVIQGLENEIAGNIKGNLCPEDYNWPPDFIKKP